MITSNVARRGHASRVFVAVNSSDAKAGGLRTDSLIMTDNLATVLLKGIATKLGSIKSLAAVDAALRHTLGL